MPYPREFADAGRDVDLPIGMVVPQVQEHGGQLHCVAQAVPEVDENGRFWIFDFGFWIVGRRNGTESVPYRVLLACACKCVPAPPKDL
jgi:hypothetical protein